MVSCHLERCFLVIRGVLLDFFSGEVSVLHDDGDFRSL